MFDLLKDKVKGYIQSLIAALEVIILVAAFFMGTHYQSLVDGRELEKQRIAMQAQIDAEITRRNLVDNVFSKKLDNLQIINTTVNKNFTKEITQPIYTDCVVPVTGTSLLNDTATKLNAARKGTGQ